MTVLSCESLTLSFGAEDVLRGVSFSLNSGDRLGIVGVNGAGKTSLFRLITGQYEPDSGAVYISRGLRVGMLSQTPLDQSDDGKTVEQTALSAFDALIAAEEELEQTRLAAENGDRAAAERYPALNDSFISRGGLTFRARTKSTLGRFGFGEEELPKPASLLSGGQKTRLALVRLLLDEPDIMLLDEPTNHLDLETMYWLEDHLRARRGTLLVISHDRYFLDRVTTRTLHLEYGKSKLYEGNYSSYSAQREKDREVQQHHYESQQREIARIEAYIEQQRRWNRERNIIAAESREKQLDKLERIERPADDPDAMNLRFHFVGESGEDVILAKDLSGGYGSRVLFDGAAFTVKKRERVFICGSNGCGKSTLLKMIAKLLSPLDGTVRLGESVIPVYYDQENQRLSDEKTVLDELWDEYPTLSQTTIRSTLARFLFKGEDVAKQVRDLSGGERARLTLCKLVLTPCNLLLLDEPTNHLDIPSREILEKAITEFPGTLIAVSHDRYFMQRLGTRFLSFKDGSILNFDGSFERLNEWRAANEAAENGTGTSDPAEKPMTDSKAAYLETKRQASEARKAEAKIRRAKEESEKTEARIEEIDRLLEGEASTDYLKCAELLEEKERLEERLLELYEIIG